MNKKKARLRYTSGRPSLDCLPQTRVSPYLTLNSLLTTDKSLSVLGLELVKLGAVHNPGYHLPDVKGLLEVLAHHTVQVLGRIAASCRTQKCFIHLITRQVSQCCRSGSFWCVSWFVKKTDNKNKQILNHCSDPYLQQCLVVQLSVFTSNFKDYRTHLLYVKFSLF